MEWESQSFNNWESIDIFVADTLSEAWVMARQQDKAEFDDEQFKRMVDGANGKWLKKNNVSDTYKIILSTKKNKKARNYHQEKELKIVLLK